MSYTWVHFTADVSRIQLVAHRPHCTHFAGSSCQTVLPANVLLVRARPIPVSPNPIPTLKLLLIKSLRLYFFLSSISKNRKCQHISRETESSITAKSYRSGKGLISFQKSEPILIRRRAHIWFHRYPLPHRECGHQCCCN